MRAQAAELLFVPALPGAVGQGRAGAAAAAAEELAVPGALHLPDPLQRLPAPGEEGLLAAALQPLDARGRAFIWTRVWSDRKLPPFSAILHVPSSCSCDGCWTQPTLTSHRSPKHQL